MSSCQILILFSFSTALKKPFEFDSFLFDLKYAEIGKKERIWENANLNNGFLIVLTPFKFNRYNI